MAVAETYDVIVTIPEGTLEVTATAQDGSGNTSIRLGNGKLYPATVIDRPDKVAMMKQMAKMDMKMGAPALVGNRKKKTPEVLDAEVWNEDGYERWTNEYERQYVDEGWCNKDGKSMEMKKDSMPTET